MRSLLHLFPSLLLAHYSFSFEREFANTMVHQWIIGCLVIAVGSLIEFIVLIYMHEVQRCEKVRLKIIILVVFMVIRVMMITEAIVRAVSVMME